MSKLVKEVVDVLKGSKDRIYSEAERNSPCGISIEQAKAIVKDQIKVTAAKMNVQPSTISSACTRSLNIPTIDAFADLVINELTTNSRQLENTLVHNSKPTLDNPADIRALLRDI